MLVAVLFQNISDSKLPLLFDPPLLVTTFAIKSAFSNVYENVACLLTKNDFHQFMMLHNEML